MQRTALCRIRELCWHLVGVLVFLDSVFEPRNLVGVVPAVGVAVVEPAPRDCLAVVTDEVGRVLVGSSFLFDAGLLDPLLDLSDSDVSELLNAALEGLFDRILHHICHGPWDWKHHATLGLEFGPVHHNYLGVRDSGAVMPPNRV